MPFAEEGVLNHLSQPGAVTKETLPLCPLLYADHRQRRFTLTCWFRVFFFSFLLFLSFPREGLCVSFGKERGERSPPQSVHGQCCCKKTVLVAFVGSSMWTCSRDLETVTLPHSPPSQVEG